MRAKKWSKTEEEFLIGAFERGLRPEDICEETGWSLAEIKRKMYRLGWSIERIGKVRRKNWSEQETETLKKCFAAGKSVKEIAVLLGRDDSTVYRKAAQLKLKPRPTVRPEKYYYSDIFCPFFERFKKVNIIQCEGIADNSSMLLLFESQRDYERYIGDFCCDKYKNCLLAKILYGKYEE